MLTTLLGSLLAQNSRSLGPIKPPSNAYKPLTDTGAGAATTLEKMISMGLGAITIGAGLYFVLNFVIAGLNWLSSGGDSGKIQKARDSIVHSLIGLIIVVAAYAVVGLIGTIFGLEILSPFQEVAKLAP